jgi:hypothetical protein
LNHNTLKVNDDDFFIQNPTFKSPKKPIKHQNNARDWYLHVF